MVSFLNAHIATGDERVAQLMRMVVREQPFERRVDGIEVGMFCLLEVDMGHDLAKHRGDGDLSRNEVIAHLFFACIAFQPVFIEDAQRCKLTPSYARIEENEQCGRRREFGVVDAEIDELFFFFVCKSGALLALMAGEDDLFHRGIKLVVACSQIEDAAENEMKFLRRAHLPFFRISEQEVLDKLSVDLCKRFICKRRGDVVFKEAFVLAEGGLLGRFLFEGEPAQRTVIKEDGVHGSGLCASRSDVVVECFDEFLFEDSGVLGRDVDVDALAAESDLIDAVLLLTVCDDLIAVGKHILKFAIHLIKLLFRKFDEVLLFLLGLRRCFRFALCLYLRKKFLQFGVRQRLDEHIQHPRRVLIASARIGGQEVGYQFFAFLLRHPEPSRREYLRQMI